MTEKQYGGATGREIGKISNNAATPKMLEKKKEDSRNSKNDSEGLSLENKDKFIKAGKIASEVMKYAREFIKKDMPLLEIADKIEAKILELGGKPAFPANLSIDEVAAHDTPSFNDVRVASGLMKVDSGVHIDGCVADNAFTLDLEDSEENKKLIKASEKALLSACKTVAVGITTSEIGSVIEQEVTSQGFTPIHNLSGHSIDKYSLHAGITIPNYNNTQNKSIEAGIYAIEPFATNGLGKVRDGKPSGIYRLERDGVVRDTFAREVLTFIQEEYQSLPFCSRWIYKKFGSRGLLALRRIEEVGILHQYAQLIEINGGKVAQTEHTLIVEEDKKTIITLGN